MRGYPPQHVAAEDRQELRAVLVEVDEAAPSGEVVVQRLQLRPDPDVVHRLELVLWRGLDGIDIELQVVLEQPPEAFQDPAGKLGMVLLVEQIDQARHPHHDADPLARPLAQVGGQAVVVEVVGDQHGHTACGEQLRAGEEVAPVHIGSACEQVAHRDLGERQHRLARDSRIFLEPCPGRLEHVEVHMRRRPEATPLHQDRLLAQHLTRLQHLTVGAEHRHAAEPELHELERHQPVVHAAELDAAELDHVNLDAARGEAVEEALDELVRLVVLEERPVQQVHPDDSERLLLQPGLDIEHPYMHDDLARLVVRLGLELHAHPAVALIAALVTARYHRIGKREEAVLVTALIAQPLDVKLEFLVEHALEPPGGHVPFRLAVHRVADSHVIGGDRLRDGASCAAHAEEPAHHLLAGPDFSDRSVPAPIEVDAQGLLVGVG